MTEYLDIEDFLDLARAATGDEVGVRDYGLIESALARPQASVFGHDAYPDIHLKAAALFQSLARNHALIDGNKRSAWVACLTFLGINSHWVSASDDEHFDFVLDVATGKTAELDEIADQLRAWDAP